MKLTDLAIRKLSLPAEGQKTHFDETLPGFGIRLSQRSKSFIVMYGDSRRLKTLGRYPQKSLRDARKEAMRYLARRNRQDTSMRYSDASEVFLAECGEKNRNNTVREYRRSLGSLDYSGDVRNITRQNLKEYVSSPHALTAFKIFFNWCMRNELVDRNPLAGDRPSYNTAKSRVLTTEELRVIWNYECPPFSNIVKLLLVLGQRRTETAAINEDWIDGDLINFPQSVTKNKKLHTIPFGQFAVPLLPPTSFNGWSKGKARMDKYVTISPWTLHDLRRTFSTIHAQIGTPIHVTEKLLNHSSGALSGVAAIYNRHTYLPQMREAVDGYESHLAALLHS